MKRVVLGSALFLAAVLGLCILCAGAVASGYSVNGSTGFVDIWRIFGVIPFAIGLVVCGGCGLLLAVWGLLAEDR